MGTNNFLVYQHWNMKNIIAIVRQNRLKGDGKMDLRKVTAPLPGTIWKVEVEVGAQVKEGDAVVILEAMKMENEIIAEMDGVVKAILVKKGDPVQAGDLLVELE